MRAMSRSNWMVVLTAVSLAACVDAPVAPVSAPVQAGVQADKVARPLKGKLKGDTLTVSFTVKPSLSGTYAIGDHSITIPAHAICDLETSSYGVGHWDDPCTPERHAVTITARVWTLSSGHPALYFEPQLRFAPSDTVVLYVKDLVAPEDASKYAIFWCDTRDRCVDEALTDPSLFTYYLPNGRFFYRRIKHFSGYLVTTSFTSSWNAY